MQFSHRVESAHFWKKEKEKIEKEMFEQGISFLERGNDCDLIMIETNK